ncbi:MAG: GDSL-type esterase/lipase family protein [Gammaproteobacteria bacterium]
MASTVPEIPTATMSFAGRVLFLVGLLLLAISGAAAAGQSEGCERSVPTGASFDWTVLPDVSTTTANAPYKIAVFGDSMTSARNFIDAALQLADVPRTATLPSFIAAGMKVKGLQLPLKSACASAGWQSAYAHKEKRGAQAFSKGFVSMSSQSPGDVVALDFRAPLASTRIKQVDIVYEKARPDDSLLLGVSVDGGDERLVPLSRSAGRVLRITPDQPAALLRVRLVSGKVTLHGFQPVYQQGASVSVDALSVPGALMQGWANVSEALAGGTEYDVILVEYGTNEGAVPAFERERYLSELRGHLARLRGFYPNAHCILIGPPDRGVVGGGLKYASIHRQIAQAQKQASAEQRCRFWDWQAAMGGPGSAAQWARADPPLMQPDLTHMTARGYELSGRLFGQSFSLKKH